MSAVSRITNDDDKKPKWDPERQIYMNGIIPQENDKTIEEYLQKNKKSIYIFGYGSLCWNPGSTLSQDGITAYEAYAIGWKRCWCQKSADHRGTPSFLGYVCTLLSNDEYFALTQKETSSSRRNTMTKGVVYEVPEKLISNVLQELDFREKGGYSRDVIQVKTTTNKMMEALLYRGTPTNPAFDKRALIDLSYAASVMSVSRGPSGLNNEYLFELNDFLSRSIDSKEENEGDMTCYLSHLCQLFQQDQKQAIFLNVCGSNQHHQLLLHTNSLFPKERNILKFTEAFAVLSSKDEEPVELYGGLGGHAALLTSCKNLYLWGWNEFHQLGRSANINKKHENILEPLKNIKVQKASLGFSHTLVLEYETNSVYGFADNSRQQLLFNATISNIIKPTLLLSEPCTHISAGVFHSAVITKSNQVVIFSKSHNCKQWKPKDDAKLIQISSGKNITLVLDEHGRVWSFIIGNQNNKYYPQLSSNSDEPTLIKGISDCIFIDCGWSHSAALIKKSTKDKVQLYAFGRNDKGQLGLGHTHAIVQEPTLVSFSNQDTILKLSCGAESTSVVIQKPNNKQLIMTTGWNEHGNLGIGNEQDSCTFTPTIGSNIPLGPDYEGKQEIIMSMGGAHLISVYK